MRDLLHDRLEEHAEEIVLWVHSGVEGNNNFASLYTATVDHPASVEITPESVRGASEDLVPGIGHIAGEGSLAVFNT